MSEQVAPPSAPSPGQPDPAVPAPPAEPAKKSGGRKVLSILGVILAVLAFGAFKFGVKSYLNRDETADAKVGDCLAELPATVGDKQESADDAKVVECTSTDAAYDVVGRVENQTEAQAASGEGCDTYIKEGQDGYVFSNIERGGKGYVLCLTKHA
ncbi:LppU/SCO3897 family protein [Micromonospora mirobrigensis]|uniref:Uncharacterized protein n=1 Tax=Micromonospora mirobrigensis TaxID=262898 RepID=A0A1C4UN76_9ACTN|nr:hypothetical protein [Micromonospora mirobrigensis]SCE73138.1 hypothetical protein GA0070564_101607 [Micromonospora mirobrigensis]